MKTTRRTPKAVAFHSQVAEFKQLLPYRYAEMACELFPELDAKYLRYAVAGRKEYWEGLPALRIVAGLDPLPKGFRFTRSPRQAATV